MLASTGSGDLGEHCVLVNFRDLGGGFLKKLFPQEVVAKQTFDGLLGTYLEPSDLEA